jgi:putative Holliday junction resolvase
VFVAIAQINAKWEQVSFVRTMEKLSVLGLDVGKKRIGVAGCDGLGLIATGLTTVIRSSFVRDVEHFKALVEERQVQLLVVGLPYTMSGEIGFQARQVQKYAQRLGVALSLRVEYIDERLTSVEAEEQMRAENISPSRNKATIDRKAAAIVLQQWLDRRRAV